MKAATVVWYDHAAKLVRIKAATDDGGTAEVSMTAGMARQFALHVMAAVEGGRR